MVAPHCRPTLVSHACHGPAQNEYGTPGVPNPARAEKYYRKALELAPDAAAVPVCFALTRMRARAWLNKLGAPLWLRDTGELRRLVALIELDQLLARHWRRSQLRLPHALVRGALHLGAPLAARVRGPNAPPGDLLGLVGHGHDHGLLQVRPVDVNAAVEKVRVSRRAACAPRAGTHRAAPLRPPRRLRPPYEQ